MQGHNDPKTDLWLLPILGRNADGKQCTPHPHSLPGPSSTAKLGVHSAMFAHSITTRANKIKFQHHALCNPKISRLLKATQRGFLKGCPYILETMILKYLNPSPATAKGCMKRPRYGIKSTKPKLKSTPRISPQIEVAS